MLCATTVPAVPPALAVSPVPFGASVLLFALLVVCAIGVPDLSAYEVTPPEIDTLADAVLVPGY